MQHGYSNILGELVPALMLEYRDCETFQVVCPNCREPLFKRVRDETHYFAHYQADAALDPNCKLRVQQYSAGDIAERAIFAREQRLRYFLDSMTALLDNTPGEPPEAVSKRRAQFPLLRRAAIGRTMIDLFVRAGEQVPLDEVIAGRAEEVYAHWDETGYEANTGFGRAQQTRAAQDLAKTLLTPTARPAFEKVFNAAWFDALVTVVAIARSEGQTEYTRVLGGFYAGVPANEPGIDRHFAWMQNTPVGKPWADTPGAVWFDRACWSLWESFCDVLLRVDYLGALKQRPGTRH